MASRGKNVRLFISDIDGCLALPYHPYDLEGFARLTELIRRPGSPAFSLCSGRAYPYVEAVSQALGLTTPVLFESGGGMFDPVKATITWHPAFTPDVERQFEEIRAWLIHDLVPGTTLMYDYGKRTQAGIIGPLKEDVDRLLPRAEEFIAANFPDFRVFHTDVSIDVVAAEVTKRQAMIWMSESLDIDLSEIAYIGDSNGDIEALILVGRSFAPANASDDVKDVVQTVSRHKVVESVIEAYRTCLEECAVPTRLAS